MEYPLDSLEAPFEHPWNKFEKPLDILLVTVSNDINSILANPATSFYSKTFSFDFDFDFDFKGTVSQKLVLV